MIFGPRPKSRLVNAIGLAIVSLVTGWRLIFLIFCDPIHTGDPLGGITPPVPGSKHTLLTVILSYLGLAVVFLYSTYETTCIVKSWSSLKETQMLQGIKKKTKKRTKKRCQDDLFDR